MPKTLTSRALDVADLTLGQAIKRLRTPTGLSARALSVKAGQSESYVGKVESGKIEPSVRAFARIARVLGLKPSEVAVLVERTLREEGRAEELLGESA